MKCRSYQSDDSSEIEALFLSTFTKSEGESEGQLVSSLVRELISDTDSHDLYGFVSVNDEDLVGAIFFSRLTFDDPTNAFLLSPVAVQSTHQGKGVGQKLISHGLQQLKRDGVSLVITYGDPAFYSKTGFSPLSEELILAPFTLSQPEGWLGQSLSGRCIEQISGRCKCVKAFDNPAYW